MMTYNKIDDNTLEIVQEQRERISKTDLLKMKEEAEARLAFVNGMLDILK